MFIIMELIISYEILRVKQEHSVCDCKMGGWFFPSSFCFMCDSNTLLILLLVILKSDLL